VPDHLYGRTLHKTLQARLSEDILSNKQFSRFYRTGPGRFFIKSDASNSVPKEYPEVRARRRALELRYKYVLSINASAVAENVKWHDIETFMSEVGGSFFYQNYRQADPDSLVIWACAILKKKSSLFSHQRGSYREDRDDFLNQRSIALYSPVIRADHDLFSTWDAGLANAIIEIVSLDLDMPLDMGWLEESVVRNRGGFVERRSRGVSTALGVVELSVPSWFEISRQRLSINDMRWIEPWSINDPAEYDPWSRLLLKPLSRGLMHDYDASWRIVLRG
jgi:hypothetical protein